MLVLTGEVHDLGHLGLCHLIRVNPANAHSTAVNVQHDIAALEATGAVPNYDLTTGVSAALLASQAQTMAAKFLGTF